MKIHATVPVVHMAARSVRLRSCAPKHHYTHNLLVNRNTSPLVIFGNYVRYGLCTIGANAPCHCLQKLPEKTPIACVCAKCSPPRHYRNKEAKPRRTGCRYVARDYRVASKNYRTVAASCIRGYGRFTGQGDERHKFWHCVMSIRRRVRACTRLSEPAKALITRDYVRGISGPSTLLNTRFTMSVPTA
jgi:hypothetical protein